MTNSMKSILVTMDWKVTNHPPYNSDAAPSNLFGPMKLQLLSSW
jgi:hypothetical protein